MPDYHIVVTYHHWQGHVTADDEDAALQQALDLAAHAPPPKVCDAEVVDEDEPF